ncbi:exported hypothetical protein [Candidatus Sulfopaludibacter sp. SbA4]|nr:exported hypothetical protein [Candidatus Sulfopaludibacter sp. SbA4]
MGCPMSRSSRVLLLLSSFLLGSLQRPLPAPPGNYFAVVSVNGTKVGLSELALLPLGRLTPDPPKWRKEREVPFLCRSFSEPVQ